MPAAPTSAWAPLLLAYLVLGSGCTLVGEDAPRPPTVAEDAVLEPNAVVTRVIDGDTVAVDINGTEERVRLIGIDTPESVAPNRPVECYGQQASDRMADLVPPGTPVHLVRDIEPRDMYQRLLAYVYRAEDGLHVNLDQVERGYAAAMPYPPNTAFQTDFAEAEHAARTSDTGLWEACGGPDVAIGPPPESQD